MSNFYMVSGVWCCKVAIINKQTKNNKFFNVELSLCKKYLVLFQSVVNSIQLQFGNLSCK